MKAKPQHYYPGLDSLRGVAILLVLNFHIFGFSPGWVGVDLFFVLSGFLITKNLLDTRDSNGYFRLFFIRRMLRIFPLYFFVLIAFYTAAPFLFSQKQPGSVYAYYTGNQLWFYTFTQNWLFVKKGLPPEPYLQHFWSLAVEEQFYLLWPFLIYLVKDTLTLQRTFVAVFLFALVTRLFLWFNPIGYEAFYYTTTARVDSLSAGAFLAVSIQRKKRFSAMQIGLAGLLFMVTLLAAFTLYKNLKPDNPVFATVGYSCSAIFFMMICYLLIQSPTWFERFGFLKFTGRISYGLYVYHVPIFLIVLFTLLNKSIHFFSSPHSAWLFLRLLTVIITLLISYFSYQIIEQPFLKFKKKFTDSVQ